MYRRVQNGSLRSACPIGSDRRVKLKLKAEKRVKTKKAVPPETRKRMNRAMDDTRETSLDSRTLSSFCPQAPALSAVRSKAKGKARLHAALGSRVKTPKWGAWKNPTATQPRCSLPRGGVGVRSAAVQSATKALG